MKFNKQEIRDSIKILSSIQEPELLEKENNKIFERTVSMKEFIDAEIVGCYLSVDGEVSTDRIIQRAFEMGKKVCVPAYFEDIKGYKYVLMEQDTSLVDGNFKIPEPKCKIEIDQSPNIAIIPGVAFDFDRNRLGHGKGYFDRLLSKLSKEVLKVGLAFSFQIVEKIETVETDIPMDKIVLYEGIMQSCACCQVGKTLADS